MTRKVGGSFALEKLLCKRIHFLISCVRDPRTNIVCILSKLATLRNAFRTCSCVTHIKSAKRISSSFLFKLPPRAGEILLSTKVNKKREKKADVMCWLTKEHRNETCLPRTLLYARCCVWLHSSPCMHVHCTNMFT